MTIKELISILEQRKNLINRIAILKLDRPGSSDNENNESYHKRLNEWKHNVAYLEFELDIINNTSTFSLEEA